MTPYIIILNKTERQTPCDITHMWNLENGTDELTYETERLTDIENRRVVPKREVGWRGTDWEFAMSRCKLLYTEWISNKVLLHST